MMGGFYLHRFVLGSFPEENLKMAENGLKLCFLVVPTQETSIKFLENLQKGIQKTGVFSIIILRLCHLKQFYVYGCMEKEKRTFQDISMTYGQVITQIASEWGMMAVYPRLLDETAIGFPVIQYRETDWEFIRRLASRFDIDW